MGRGVAIRQDWGLLGLDEAEGTPQEALGPSEAWNTLRTDSKEFASKVPGVS